MNTNYDKDIYISVDIESDGPCPGLHSMLSLGCAAFTIERELLSSFECNFEEIPEATQNPNTMSEFWSVFPEMYAATRTNLVSPEEGMDKLQCWLNGLKSHGRLTFVAYPSRFDMRWVDYYALRFLNVNENLLGLGAIDVKTAASVVLKKPFRDTHKKTMPKHWFTSDRKHTHLAIDDAIEQGEMAINILREAYNLPQIR